MTFETYAYSDKGGRGNNEDCYIYRNGIWVLADGLGGHASGEVASRSAANAAARFAEEKGISVDDMFLNNILSSANRDVIERQKESELYTGMSTTIVIAVTDGISVRYANVGDSRFYYFQNGSISCFSEDHSVSALSVKLGDISYEDIRGDDDRNKLLKVLGHNSDLNVKIPETIIEAQSGDAFLLCSDGFWEYVYEREMEIDLAKSMTPKEWLGYMIKRIILRTKNIDNDNFTAIGVMISD